MELQEGYDLKPARRTYSRVGWALSAVIGATFLISLAMEIVIQILSRLGLISTASTLLYWLRITVPLYLAIIVGLLILRSLPAAKPEKAKLGAKNFFVFIPICFFLSYSGNIFGNLMSGLLSGGEAENAVAELAMDTSFFKVLYMVILAPLVEEFVFRKQIIDRTVRYGEKAAVLFSAITFGLFHGNMFQFPYAFLLGWVFAYIYVRTGKLRFPVIYHFMINFMGAVVSPFVLSLTDAEAVAAMEAAETEAEYMAAYAKALPGMIGNMLFTWFVLFMFVLGLILLILRCKRLVWKQREEQMPKGKSFSTVYINAGVIVFTLLCIGQFVLALL